METNEKYECSECKNRVDKTALLLCPLCGAGICMGCATSNNMLCPYCNGMLR